MSAFLPIWEIEPLVLAIEAAELMDEDFCERTGKEQPGEH